MKKQVLTASARIPDKKPAFTAVLTCLFLNVSCEIDSGLIPFFRSPTYVMITKQVIWPLNSHTCIMSWALESEHEERLPMDGLLLGCHARSLWLGRRRCRRWPRPWKVQWPTPRTTLVFSSSEKSCWISSQAEESNDIDDHALINFR